MPRKKEKEPTHQVVRESEKPATAFLPVEGEEQDPTHVPGAVPYLTQLTQARINAGLLTTEQLCEGIGITPPYVRHLLNGTRQWSRMPFEKLRAVADLLDIRPRVSVFMMAGVLDAEDFIDGPLQDVLRDQYKLMKKDPTIGPLLPPRAELHALPLEMRKLIIMMWLEILKLRTLAAKDVPSNLKGLREEDLAPAPGMPPLEF